MVLKEVYSIKSRDFRSVALNNNHETEDKCNEKHCDRCAEHHITASTIFPSSGRIYVADASAALQYSCLLCFDLWPSCLHAERCLSLLKSTLRPKVVSEKHSNESQLLKLLH